MSVSLLNGFELIRLFTNLNYIITNVTLVCIYKVILNLLSNGKCIAN